MVSQPILELQNINKSFGHVQANKNVSFDSSIYKRIENFSWPGNVRQLGMWISRICRKYKDIQLVWDEIPNLLKPEKIKDSSSFEFPELPIDYNQYITELRLHALDIANGNKAKTDRLLGMKDGTTKQWLHQRKNRV